MAEDNRKRLENLKVPTHDEAVENGRRGGIKSGEARKRKKNARETARYLINLAATGKLAENLEKYGVEEEEQTHLAAMLTRIMINVIQNGDIRSFEEIMRYAGYDPEQQRKERESAARIRAMEKSGIPVGPENESSVQNDVMIILPDDGRGISGCNPISQSQFDDILNKG